jgi:hypothetical protein
LNYIKQFPRGEELVNAYSSIKKGIRPIRTRSPTGSDDGDSAPKTNKNNSVKIQNIKIQRKQGNYILTQTGVSPNLPYITNAQDRKRTLNTDTEEVRAQ